MIALAPPAARVKAQARRGAAREPVEPALRSRGEPVRGDLRSPLERVFGLPLRLSAFTFSPAAGLLQTKLAVGHTDDPLEHEADRIADQVMRGSVSGCCGGTPPQVRRKCAGCDEDEQRTLRATPAGSANAGGSAAPDIVHDVLRSPGQPLDASTREFFEPHFGRSFSDVRVHDGAQAGASARAVDALAYTVNRDVVFGSGRYAPGTSDGRRLLAHELAHVVQQSGGASAAVRRQNTRETAAVLRTGTVRGSGLQFWPLQVASTRIGPVSGSGGLLATSTGLSVIVGQAMTINRIARLLLPLWNSATPFTPAGATTPLVTGPLSEDQLARGLLVFNRSYLRVLTQPAPAMSGFSAGLRFPVPVEIDADGEGVVNKDLILGLAGTFDATWGPLLDQAASAVVAAPAADVSQAVATFTANPDSSTRGVALAARSITNAVEARAFVLEAFNQSGSGTFDVALAFMGTLVNANVAALASQRDGAAILGGIRAALAAAPATLSPAQQTSLTRANLMLGATTAIVARDVPYASPNAISAAGIDMIVTFEGFCPNLYDDGMRGCGRGRGNCTVGIGHLVHSGPCNGTDASETPFLGGITRAQGDVLLTNELTRFVNAVTQNIRVPLTQAQFDALVSFHFNTGRLNALTAEINANHFAAVPGIMNQFVNARIGGVMTRMGGLVDRRAAEGTLFQTGAYP